MTQYNEPEPRPSSPLPPSRFGAGYTVGGPPQGVPVESSSPLRYPEPTYASPPPIFESDTALRYPDPAPAVAPPPPPVAPAGAVVYGTPVTMVAGGYIPVRRPTNGMAIASLVCSLVLPFIGWLLGIVFGHIALSQIKQTGDEGRGLAIAGLAISYAAVGFFFIWWVVLGMMVARF